MFYGWGSCSVLVRRVHAALSPTGNYASLLSTVQHSPSGGTPSACGMLIIRRRMHIIGSPHLRLLGCIRRSLEHVVLHASSRSCAR